MHIQRSESHIIYPADLLAKAGERYFPEIPFELWCEPFFEKGKPHWAFDNYRCNGAVSYDVSPLFYTQPGWGKFFEEKGIPTKCITYACDPDLHAPIDCEKLYDVGFVGNIEQGTQRYDEIETVKKLFTTHISTDTPSKDISRFYSECKVIFNPQRFEEINIRFFEALALGAQVVRYSPALHLFAREGEMYLSYRTIEQAIWNIQYLLDHPDEREKMARRARAHALHFHTYKHRIEDMLRFMDTVRGGI